MENLLWVGSRLADIETVEDLFLGAISLFGSSKIQTPSACYESKNMERLNQNSYLEKEKIRNFYHQEIEAVLKKNPEAQFLSYGGESNLLGDRVRTKNFPYSNSSRITKVLQDKFKSRKMVSSFCQAVDSICLFRRDCNKNNLEKIFPHTKNFVIQAISGAGGEGTALVPLHQLPEGYGLTTNLPPGYELIASPFIESSLPINSHVLIGKHNIIVLPESIQLIEKDSRGRLLYRGGDFYAAQQLPSSIKAQLNQKSIEIARRIQDMGYLGVMGIDFLATKDEVIFVEVNTRFQASTFILNKYLREIGMPSVHHLHISAFKGQRLPEYLPGKVNYSFIVFHAGDNTQTIRLCEKNRSCEVDSFELKNYVLSLNAPLARACFSQPLISIENYIISPSSFFLSLKIPTKFIPFGL